MSFLMNFLNIFQRSGNDSFALPLHSIINEGLIKSVKSKRDNLCMGCFTGNYPIPVQLEMDKLILETES